MHLLDRLADLPFTARLLVVAGAIGAATVIGLAAELDVEQASLVLLVAVVCCALLGRSWGLFGAVLAAGMLNLAFTPPHWTLRVGNGDDTIALVTFGLIAVTVGAIVAMVTDLRRDAERRAVEADLAARERYDLERAAEAAQAAAELSRTRAGLLSAVSHNLRTPLAAIQASSTARRARATRSPTPSAASSPRRCTTNRCGSATSSPSSSTSAGSGPAGSSWRRKRSTSRGCCRPSCTGSRRCSTIARSSSTPPARSTRSCSTPRRSTRR